MEKETKKKRKVVVEEDQGNRNGSSGTHNIDSSGSTSTNKRPKREAAAGGAGTPLIFSMLGSDEVIHIMSFFNEEELLQCESAYKVFHDVSRSGTVSDSTAAAGTAGYQIWRDLHNCRRAKLGRYHAEFDPPRPRDGQDQLVLSQLYGSSNLWMTTASSTTNGHLKKIWKLLDTYINGNKNENEDNDVLEMMNQRRYFGIMAIKAREYERHQWLFHQQGFSYEPPDDDYENNSVEEVSSCKCEEFTMNQLNFDQRCAAWGNTYFVSFSLRRRQGDGEPRNQSSITSATSSSINQPFWQGWCDANVRDDQDGWGPNHGELYVSISNKWITGEYWSKVRQIQNKFRLKEEQEEATQAQQRDDNDGIGDDDDDDDNENNNNNNVSWTTEEKDEICNLANEVIPELRITIINSRGSLIVATGGHGGGDCTIFCDANPFNETPNCVHVYFRVLQVSRGRDSKTGIPIYLKIQSDKIELSFFEKRSPRWHSGGRLRR